MYVWELPVRVTHWLIVVSIAVLAVTGYYIGDPFIAVSGPARDHFVMGTMRVIHLYAAIVFTGCSPAITTRVGPSSFRPRASG
jgi:Ni/Fe-hydrogenase 1 B-type cytochrome subunit